MPNDEAWSRAYGEECFEGRFSLREAAAECRLSQQSAAKWIRRYRQVVVMSEQDRALLARPNVTVIPNGVDLDRFIPEIERPGQRLLFIGSFRHFPNIVAYRFFVDRVWPILREKSAEITLTVVTGPEPLLYWRAYTGLSSIPPDDRIRLLEFVADVRPLYVEANLAIVPTLESAGTNLKVLEAMEMDRAVVETRAGLQAVRGNRRISVSSPWIFSQLPGRVRSETGMHKRCWGLASRRLLEAPK